MPADDGMIPEELRNAAKDREEGLASEVEQSKPGTIH
jgi:hypothetical protein